MNIKSNVPPPSKGGGFVGGSDGGGIQISCQDKRIKKQRKRHLSKKQRKSKVKQTVREYFKDNYSCCRLWIGLCIGLSCVISNTWAGFACLSNPCVFGVCIDDLNR